MLRMKSSWTPMLLNRNNNPPSKMTKWALKNEKKQSLSNVSNASSKNRLKPSKNKKSVNIDLPCKKSRGILRKHVSRKSRTRRIQSLRLKNKEKKKQIGGRWREKSLKNRQKRWKKAINWWVRYRIWYKKRIKRRCLSRRLRQRRLPSSLRSNKRRLKKILKTMMKDMALIKHLAFLKKRLNKWSNRNSKITVNSLKVWLPRTLPTKSSL